MLILDKLKAALPVVDSLRLDQLYSDYQIDAEAEQQALVAADTYCVAAPFLLAFTACAIKKMDR